MLQNLCKYAYYYSCYICLSTSTGSFYWIFTPKIVPIAPPPANVECKEHLIDIAFLVDGSDSILPEDFDVVREWILHVVDGFNPAERRDGLKIDIVQFSHVAELEIDELVTTGSDQIRDQVMNIDQMRSGTKTYSALRYLNSNVVPRLRNGSFRILITLTDGRASEDADQQAIANAEFNFQLRVGVGIGDKVKEEELADFSTHEEVLTVDDFAALDDIIANIIDQACQGVHTANVAAGN